MRLALLSLILATEAIVSVLPASAADDAATTPPVGAAYHAAPAAQTMSHWHPPSLSLAPAQPPAIPLSTLLNSVEFSIDKTQVQLGKLRGVILSVHNNTNLPLVLDANLASAAVGAITYQSAPRRAVEKAATPQNSRSAKTTGAVIGTILGATTIGAYQAVRDQHIEDGPVLRRYGTDQQRRTAEAEDFGNRVIWPGQTGKGIVYFAAPSLAGATITMPMKELFDPTNGASLSGHLVTP